MTTEESEAALWRPARLYQGLGGQFTQKEPITSSCWAAPDWAVKGVNLVPPIRRLGSRKHLLVPTVRWRMGPWNSIWKSVGCVWTPSGSISEEEAPKVKSAEGLIGVEAESLSPLHFSGFKINPWAFHPRFSKHFVNIKIIYCHISNGETVVGPSRNCRNVG